MQQRHSLSLALASDETRKLDRIADNLHVSRSEAINQAIQECLRNPQALGNTIANAFKAQTPRDDKFKQRTSIMVDSDYIPILEKAAAAVFLSRSALIHLIVIGVTSGTIILDHGSTLQ